MVARIQNLYLFLAGLLAVGSIFLPFWSFSAGRVFVISDFATFSTPGIMYVTESCFAAGVFSPLTAVLSLVAIFLFKNRALQSKIILFAILLFLGDLFSGLTAAHFLNQYLQNAGAIVTHKPEAGFFMILPEPVLFLMALKGVKKDDKIANAYKRL
ncbi:MAG: DUF4293 domain-containing protein [Chlorobium sp.]|jgi:Domain of unknown function (DUF4293)|nr:MAG: DUF4293 family protein [Chlorobium sp.]